MPAAAPQHGLGIGGGRQDVGVGLGRGRQRHRRHGEQDLGVGVDQPQFLDEQPDVLVDLVHIEIVEDVLLGIEHPAVDAGADRIDRAVLARHPALGQAQGEDEDVQVLEHLPHAGQVPFAVGPHLGLGREAAGLDRGPEGIDDAAVGARPDVVLGCELAVGPPQQLQQLARGVEIAVARREQAVVVRLGHRARHDRVGRLGHVVVIAAELQMPGDVLGEATAGGRHLGVRADPQVEPADRIDRPGAGAATDRRQNALSGRLR